MSQTFALTNLGMGDRIMPIVGPFNGDEIRFVADNYTPFQQEYSVRYIPPVRNTQRVQTRHAICSKHKRIMKFDAEIDRYYCPVCGFSMTQEQFIRRQQEKGGIIRREAPLRFVSGNHTYYHLDSNSIQGWATEPPTLT